MRSIQRPVLALFLFLIASAGLLIAGRFAYFALLPLKAGSTDKVVIEINRGQTPADIARTLVGRSVVSDSRQFTWLGRLSRQWKKVKAGEYEVSPGQTPIEVLATITSGISLSHPVTVREGENMFEIAIDLNSKGLASAPKFLALCTDAKLIAILGLGQPAPPTLEGYLFPDTYFFNKTLSADDMVKQMVHRFQTAWSSKEKTRAQELGMSENEVITLASMIEKETGAPSERPMISSVFHNRLKKHMRMQSDPTTIYGIWEHYRGNLHKEDLSAPTVYNTYTIPALPPGPISNPGKEAIDAALFPANSEFLFFVSHNDGTHEFTVNYEDHRHAVRKFQLDPKAREGKSWRDLTKNRKNGKT